MAAATTAKEEKADWLELPNDLLNLIMDNLMTTDYFMSDDYIRFGSVCVSWRSAFNEHKNNPLPPRPALFHCSSMSISTTSYMDDGFHDMEIDNLEDQMAVCNLEERNFARLPLFHCSSMSISTTSYMDDGFHDMEICNLEDQMAVCNQPEERKFDERHFPPDVKNTSIQPFPFWIHWRGNHPKRNPSSNSSEPSLPKRRRIYR